MSSLISPGSVPSEIVRAWAENAFEICLSDLLFEEIGEVIHRPAIRKAARISTDVIEEFPDLLARTAFWTKISATMEAIVENDPDDDLILATAIAGQADVIVSGDKHMLEIGEYRGIPIATPRRFIELLGTS